MPYEGTSDIIFELKEFINSHLIRPMLRRVLSLCEIVTIYKPRTTIGLLPMSIGDMPNTLVSHLHLAWTSPMRKLVDKLYLAMIRTNLL